MPSFCFQGVEGGDFFLFKPFTLELDGYDEIRDEENGKENEHRCIGACLLIEKGDESWTGNACHCPGRKDAAVNGT